MKRGKDEEKTMGPMFPRLHVNDTEKGGPRAPPRNKMALYEQLSIPSQRCNSGVLPPNPNNSTDTVHSTSSSQGIGHGRGMFSPLHLPRSVHPAQRSHPHYSDVNNSFMQLEQTKKLDEDDFTVPVFVDSRTETDHTKHKNTMVKEKLSLQPYLGSSTRLQNASDKEPKLSRNTGLNLRQEGRIESEENLKEFVTGRERSVKTSSNLSFRENNEGTLKQTNASSSYKDRLQETDGQNKCRPESRPDNTICGDGVMEECITGIDNGNSSIPMREGQSAKQRFPVNCINHLVSHEYRICPDDRIDHMETCKDMICRSSQTGNMDQDDVSETSMVDSISGLDISPDDVVGIIGQKHFWKARAAISNQQRVFAGQVFELHRLIKVQRLIAGSPHLLLDENAYLGKPLKGDPPAKKLPPEYILKAPTNNIVKQKDDSEKPNQAREYCAENAVDKASLPFVQNGNQPSNHGSFLGNPPTSAVTTDTKGPWSFHQPPGHQWLIPVMSPSEGLVYKPYPGPGFMGPVYGPTGPPPMMGNFFSPVYGVPAAHHYRGMEILPFAPTTGHGYFPPYCMAVMNPVTSGSGVEQMNPFAALGLHGQLPGAGAKFNLQHQSSHNLPSQKNEAFSNVVKLPASKESDIQNSTASTPSERAQGIGLGHTTDGTNALPLFPMSPVVDISDGAPQLREDDQPARVIKVVPHNAGSANESAARIFQSIQEERQHLDSL